MFDDHLLGIVIIHTGVLAKGIGISFDELEVVPVLTVAVGDVRGSPSMKMPAGDPGTTRPYTTSSGSLKDYVHA